jgi:hypothetical protein
MSQSFHVAFNEAVVFESHPVSRITCIACWGKFLVVGTEKGHLLIYDFIPERMFAFLFFSLSARHGLQARDQSVLSGILEEAD